VTPRAGVWLALVFDPEDRSGMLLRNVKLLAKDYTNLRHVALVTSDVSEEPSASIIRVTRIGELGQH
jgi:hypothetical protein